MTIRNIEDLKHILPKQGRVIGLDLGSKTIGVAISDLGRLIASPYKTITRKKFRKDCKNIASIIEHQQIAGVILGYPINMDGTYGPRAQSTRQFAVNLIDELGITLSLWDERLSTVAVTRTMIEADLSRARQKQVVDKMAAAFILQGALDYLKTISDTSGNSA